MTPEQQAAYIVAQAAVLNGRIAGMAAMNQSCAIRGVEPRYVESDFDAEISRSGCHHNDVIGFSQDVDPMSFEPERPMVVTQIRTAAELRAHYAGIRRRLTSAATPPPAAPPPTTSDAAPIPTPKPKPAPPAPGKPLDLPVASAINKLPIRSIQIEVAKAFGMTVGIMLSPLRAMPFVVPRQLAMALCRLHGYSSSTIGRAFGRDRTTVIHAFNQFDRDRLPIDIDPIAHPFVWITAARDYLISTGRTRCLNLDDLSGWSRSPGRTCCGCSSRKKGARSFRSI